mgnify:CR=1 FL=1
MKTLSIVVREVWHAMCKEYVDEVMTAPDGLRKKWNFPKLRCYIYTIDR